MALYLFRVLDRSGDMLMGNGYGDYIEAPDAANARTQAEAIFREPINVEGDGPAGKFLASVAAKQSAAIRDGFTIEITRKRS